MANYEQKKSYLDILAVFHYVIGGISVLIAMAALAFMGIGLGASSGWGDHFEPEATCGILVIMFLILVVVGGYGALNLLAGRALHARRSRPLIMVTAAVNCLNVPLGTLLGIFTFVLIADPQVNWIFEQGRGGAFPPPAPGYDVGHDAGYGGGYAPERQHREAYPESYAGEPAAEAPRYDEPRYDEPPAETPHPEPEPPRDDER